MKILIVCVVLVLVLAVVAAMVLQNTSRYGGGISGGQAIPGSTLQNCYELQRNKDGKPLFAIVWRGLIAGTSTWNGDNLVVAIHDHRVSPNLRKRAVYAIQEDYTLKEIALSYDEVNHILQLMDDPNDPRPILENDAIWQKKVVSNLQILPPGSVQGSTSR